MYAFILALSAALMLPAAAATAAPRTPLSVQQIVTLLKAGIGQTVILRQVEATGTRLALGVPELLELKAAGAGDALLEALVFPISPMEVPPDGPSPATGTMPSGIRVYREVNNRGEEVLHLTNLDALGRRIGGEIEVEERTPPTPPDQAAPAPQAPVIVNIYPPAAPAEPPELIAGDDWPPELTQPRGLYPGLLPGWPRNVRPHGPARAFGAHEEIFGRPPIINTAPYRSGNAAQRNRTSFRRN
jgi:hypothetical protein